MSLGVKVTHDFTKQVMASLSAIAREQTTEVLVGIPGSGVDRKDGKKIANAELGYIHEFGSTVKNIPPRPFLVPGVDSQQEEISVELQNGLVKAIGGNHSQLATSFKRAGTIGRDAVKSFIKAGNFEPLSDVTLRRRLAKRRKKSKKITLEQVRASTTPLIDTAEMLNSVTFVVRPRD